MPDDDESSRPRDAYQPQPSGHQVDSCTLIVRLSSGVELEYDLDPRLWPRF